MKSILFFTFILSSIAAFAQNEDTVKITALPSVIIKAFEQNRKLKDVPAAISYVNKETLETFSPSSIVSALNASAGVRMEERSPGSYRLNIRGSSLRSPFGVRNVKIYYNDIPFTDPGGHSYLNQLGYFNFNSIEIIKGSNNSLYGAGTGGVMLIESINENEKPGVFSEYAGGSYHLQNMYVAVSTASDKLNSHTGFQHQSNSGYRDHSKLQRDVFSWNGLFHFGRNKLVKSTFLYGDLFYQTPGALTKAEFDANPKAARPGNAFFPGAEAANASIHQKMFLAGASYTQPISTRLLNKTTLYGMFTELVNPTINNYGKSSEPHTGGRTVFQFTQPFKNSKLNLDFGAELQQGFTSVAIHKNVSGRADSLRTFDEINNRQQFLFAQATVDAAGWSVMTGASLNMLRIKFERFAPASLGKQNRSFNNEVAPRVALMKRFKNLNVYTSISKGFSPPTTAELLPTGGAVNFGLNPEEGTTYDLGVKAIFFSALYVDITAFSYSLKNTIVQRRDAGGGDFFVNAGSTKQRGIETNISYPLLSARKIKNGFLWLSHTWYDFHYKKFKQLDNDFSGKQLPSVPPHAVSFGFDILMNNGFLGSLTYYYNDKIALNDANSAYSNPCHLIGAKAGYEKWINNKFRFKIFLGVENVLNVNYSLGNDINGFGGRYFNAAPKRNYFAAVVLQLITKAQPVESVEK